MPHSAQRAYASLGTELDWATYHILLTFFQSELLLLGIFIFHFTSTITKLALQRVGLCKPKLVNRENQTKWLVQKGHYVKRYKRMQKALKYWGTKLYYQLFCLFVDSVEIYDCRWRSSNEEPSLQADSGAEYSLCSSKKNSLDWNSFAKQTAWTLGSP